MKNKALKVIGMIAFLVGVVIFFTQCETDLNGLDQGETATAVAEMRSPGDGICLNDGVPLFTKEELCDNLTTNFAKEPLSDAEIEAVQFMREEEKMARDVYLTLSEEWTVPVFTNISKSEQRHMDAVGCLIDKYDLEDPAAGNPVGVFENESVQKLYDQFVALGRQGLKEGFTAGAKIEDLDIYDLQRTIPEMDNQDIIAVFTNLTAASKNHLRAFVRQLERLGVTFEPVYLTPEEVETILSSAPEPGTRPCTICTDCPNVKTKKAFVPGDQDQDQDQDQLRKYDRILKKDRIRLYTQ